MAITLQKFNCFVQDLGRGVHNLNSNTLKVMLTDVPPVATNAVLTDLTEITAGNGYSAGGTAIGSNAFTQTGGIGMLAGNNVTFTAVTGPMATFRYAAIYNSTASGHNLIGWYDYGSEVTLAVGQAFTVAFDGTNGILQVS